MLKGNPESWQKLPGESAAQYEAFLYFLKMGADRSLRKAYQATGATWRWAERWKWVDRAEAFDSHIAAQSIEGIIEARVAANIRQAEIGVELQEFARQRLDQFREHGGKMTPYDAARIAQIGATMERLALGEPTRNVEETRKSLEAVAVQVEVHDSRKVSD